MSTKHGDTLPIGVFGRPHGVRGEIAFRPYNVESNLFDGLSVPFSLWLPGSSDGSGERELVVVGLRATGPAGPDSGTSSRYLLRIEGVGDRESAQRLTNQKALVSREALAPLETGESYVEDVVGAQVFDQQDRPRGRVQSVFWNGAHHVVCVVQEHGKNPGEGSRETLLPLVPEYILDLDAAAGRLQMTFFEDEDADEGGASRT